MSTAPDPEALVRALAEEHVPPEPPEVLAARRERMVANISRSVRESVVQGERRTWLRRLGAAMAVAASLAASVGAYESFRASPAPVAQVSNSIGDLRSVTGTLVVTHAGRSQVVPVATRLKLAAGDELRTAADGAAELQVGRSDIRVASATQLTLMAPSSADERFRLASGRIDLEVSKQPGATRSVVVETPNADVVVRGTIFSVVVGADSGAPVTRVRVQEGSVWVLHKGDRDLVTTGEEWSSSKPRSVAAPLPIAPPVAAAPQLSLPSPRASSHSSRGKAPVSASSALAETGTLAEENSLFQSAIDARNRGDDQKALTIFASLLSKYPRSRLAEEARVERMRALRRLGDANRAAVEARRYLADHGSGFAREEARSIALGEK